MLDTMIPMIKRSLGLLKRYKLVLPTFLLLALIGALLASSKTTQPPLPVFNFNEYDVDPSNYPIHHLMIERFGSELSSWSLAKRCETFFDLLYKTTPEWKLKPRFGRDQYPDDNPEVINDIHIFNVYNECFLDGNANEVFQKFEDIDHRVYPHLSFNYPVFEHWDGEIVYTIPQQINKFQTNIQNQGIRYEESNIIKADNKSPYWSQFKSQINGDGIIVSVSDKFIEEILKLVSLLRVLGNTLPIQFMYKDDLNEENKSRIVGIARGEFDNHIDENLVKNHIFFTNNAPQQDVWFVNLAKCIDSGYDGSFSGYFNKEIAYLFNSFQNMILLDTDIILFKPPQELFNSIAFKKSGTWFFKDRNLPYRVSDSYIENFVKKASPNLIDNALFNMKTVTNETWNNEYFTERYFHYQESGVIVMDRLKHWKNILLTPHLTLLDVTLNSSYGDKEHFFMSFILTGSDAFEFNDHWTASVGELEFGVNYKWARICSSHPGHIDEDDNTLLWLNSGPAVCGARDAFSEEEDFKFFKEHREFTSVEALEEYYSSVLVIRNAVIPPESKYDLELESQDYMPTNPATAFQKLRLCNERMWCAYDMVRDGSLPEYRGRIIQFDHGDVDWYHFLMLSYKHN